MISVHRGFHDDFILPLHCLGIGVPEPPGQAPVMLLFVVDLHYTLKQFDWLVAHAAEFDLFIIGGDLLDLVPART